MCRLVFCHLPKEIHEIRDLELRKESGALVLSIGGQAAPGGQDYVCCPSVSSNGVQQQRRPVSASTSCIEQEDWILSTALLRYNSHNRQFTQLKYAIQ